MKIVPTLKRAKISPWSSGTLFLLRLASVKCAETEHLLCTVGQRLAEWRGSLKRKGKGYLFK